MKTLDKVLGSVSMPDFVYRSGIKLLLKKRLDEEILKAGDNPGAALERYKHVLRSSPVAVATQEANEQHYEVPAEFYKLVLGKHLKYSGCFYPTSDASLSEAEDAMLSLYIQRAEIEDGQAILELGCGWGSLTLFFAARFPNCHITAVSNSHSQKNYIDSQAKDRNLTNITVLTKNVAELKIDQAYDRILSVEMFEHLKNYEEMFHRLDGWLTKKGKVFIHIFGHRLYGYPFENEGESSWMARHFFSGGQMPAKNLLPQMCAPLECTNLWEVDGRHYQHTCQDWLDNMDAHKSEIMVIFYETYGDKASMFWRYWRLFFMACGELFGYNDGSEWMVYHYLFSRS